MYIQLHYDLWLISGMSFGLYITGHLGVYMYYDNLPQNRVQLLNISLRLLQM